MDNQGRRRAPGALWALVFVAAVLLAGCGGAAGGGEGSGDTVDTAGAISELEKGKAELVGLAETSDTLTEFPYSNITSITGHFEQADKLDPTLDEVKFWSGLTTVFTFLNSAEARTFLAKLGWETIDTELVDLFNRVGQYTDSSGLCPDPPNPDDPPCTPTQPPLHSFGLPNDPLADTDPNPCIDAESLECVASGADWVPFHVYFMGHPEDGAASDSFLSFQEVYVFVTQTLGNAVHGAVAKLKAISPDFSITLTLNIPGDDPDEGPVGYTFNRFEVSLIQAFYGVLDVMTSLPTIWTWNGVDDFVHTNINSVPDLRDPVSGDIVGAMPDLSAEAVDYFKNGISGGAPPLQSNPAGVTRLNGALSDLLGAVKGALDAIVATGGQLPGHLFNVATLFNSYTDEAAVFTYGVGAISGTLGEVRSALAGARTVHLYMPIAQIQDFTTCSPGGDVPAGALAGNAANSGAFPLTFADLVSNGYEPADVSVGTYTIDVDPDTTTVPLYGSAYAFVFSVPTTEHVSIWTEDLVSGDGVDTYGDLAYVDDSGSMNLVAWDSDEYSGGASHFGISIDHTYTTDGTTMPGIDTTGGMATFVLMVQDRTAPTGFRLHIQTTTSDTPVGMPIFLKGFGRRFVAKTYSVGSVQVNLGAALTVVSRFFQDSKRSTFDILTTSVEDPPGSGQFHDEQYPKLMYSTAVLKTKLQSVFPALSIPVDSVLNTQSEIDVFDTATLGTALNGVTIGGLSVTELNVVEAPAFGTKSFCTYPQNLSTMNALPGGHLAFGF